MTDTRWQLVAYVFVSIILWMVAAQLSRRQTGFAWTRRLASEGWALPILRFVYYVGLPYVALILGVVPGRYLGLVGLDQLQASRSALGGLKGGLLARIRADMSLVILDWLPDVGTLAGLGALTLLLLGITWLGYGYFRHYVVSKLGTHPLSLEGEETRSAIQIVYQAIHWSFYRSAVWLLTGDLYLGVVGGVLLVAAEWVLDPGWTDRTRHALAREGLLIDASVLIGTSAIFFFVPNLWLLLPVHWLLAKASRWMVRLAQRERSSLGVQLGDGVH